MKIDKIKNLISYEYEPRVDTDSIYLKNGFIEKIGYKQQTNTLWLHGNEDVEPRSKNWSSEMIKQWCSKIENLLINTEDISLFYLNTDNLLATKPVLGGPFKKIEDAAKEYSFDDNLNKKSISKESIRFYLFLVPALERLSYHLSVDSDTGFVNLGFRSRETDLLSALVTDGGEIHFSYVGRKKRIIKISGTAKIKHREDAIVFEKILRML